MQVSELQVFQFRNLERLALKFSSGMNWIVGPNGSGKTSLLEAVFVLATGRSFRTHWLPHVIQQGTGSATVFLKDQNANVYSFQKKKEGTQLKINSEPVRLAELASTLPVMILEMDLYQIWGEGSLARRRLLNWGVFHAFPEARPFLVRYERALKHRNALLKARRPDQELPFWDQQLSQLAEPIHHYRERYWSLWEPLLKACGERFLAALKEGGERINWEVYYDPGWDVTLTGEEAFKKAFSKDWDKGHTTIGPHRADLKFSVQGIPVQYRLSRGEQKALGFALQLSQLLLLKQHYGIQPVLLIDDLPSELDAFKTDLILNFLNEETAQVLLTSVDEPDPKWGRSQNIAA